MLYRKQSIKIGAYCNPKFLDLVVTAGKDANLFLAPMARQNGCQVYEAKNAIDAGNFVAEKVKRRGCNFSQGLSKWRFY